MSLTIVVGSSRCGSTMLSRMLAMHPRVLSISEFWNIFLETEGHIPTQDMGGEEFWRRITAPAPQFDGLVTARIIKNPLVFESRFSYATGMPSLCRILAWSVSGSPDPLYDSLAAVVPAWPARPVALHCRALFAELAAALGRPVIVERTGGSLYHVELLLEQYPEARFVFLHRDGPDVALSMSRHPTNRLAAMRTLAGALSSSSPSDIEMVPPELRMINPAEFEGLTDPPYDKRRFLGFQLPLTYYGGMWSIMTRMGTRELRTVPRDKLLIMRYETLLTDPRAELSRLAAFMEMPADPQWLDKNSEFANPKRIGSAAAGVHPMDLAALRASCAVGNRAFDQLESEFATAS